MGSCLFKFLALAQALLLALPAGWCCLALGDPVTDAPAGPPACRTCSGQDRAAESGSRPAPQPSETDCCCERGLALPATPEKVVQELPLATPGADAPRADARPVPSAGTNPVPPSMGRPLHVLHCVWLC